MVSYLHRPLSGHITCYLNRTYHVLTTDDYRAVDNLGTMSDDSNAFSYFGSMSRISLPSRDDPQASPDIVLPAYSGNWVGTFESRASQLVTNILNSAGVRRGNHRA